MSPVGVINGLTQKSAGFVSTRYPQGTVPLQFALMPDGLHAYVYSGDSDDVHYIDLKTGALLLTINIPMGIGALGISPDGKRLVIPGGSGTGSLFQVCFVDTATQAVVKTTMIPGQTNPYFYNYQFGFSSDSSKVYLPSPIPFTAELYVLDTKNGATLNTATLPTPVAGFASAASANRLVISGADSGGGQAVVSILDSNTFTLLKQVAIPNAYCSGEAAIDSSATTAYVISAKSCISTIQRNTPTTISSIDVASGTIRAHTETVTPVTLLAVAPSGTYLYAATAGAVFSYAALSLTPAASFGQPGLLDGLAVSANGALVYAANGTNARATYIAQKSGSIDANLPVGAFGATQGFLDYMATSNDGATTFASTPVSDGVTVLNNTNQTIVAYLPLKRDPLLIACHSSSGPLYAYSRNGSALYAVDITTGEERNIEFTQGYEVAALAVSPDGSQIWMTEEATEGAALIYDAATLALMGSVPVASAGPIAFSPDGTHAYIGTYAVPTAAVLDVDTATLQVNRTISLPVPLAESITVSPDGRLLYVLANQSILTVNAETGTTLRGVVVGLFAYHNPSLTAISSDGADIYIADGYDLTVYHTASGTVDAPVVFPDAIAGLSFTQY